MSSRVDAFRQGARFGQKLLGACTRQRLDDTRAGELEELGRQAVAGMPFGGGLEQALGHELVDERLALNRIEREIATQVVGADAGAFRGEADDARERAAGGRAQRRGSIPKYKRSEMSVRVFMRRWL